MLNFKIFFFMISTVMLISTGCTNSEKTKINDEFTNYEKIDLKIGG